MRLISKKKAERILLRYAGWIEEVSKRYDVPSAAIKAILSQEMEMMDFGDLAADVVVRLGIFKKKDSSTGYAQIFGYVGLNAANFAVDRGIATYESLGIRCDHRLDPDCKEDVRLIWKLLHDDPMANIELATLNLLCAADEVIGRTDFETFTEHDMKMVFTRYNSKSLNITSYGEEAYKRYAGSLV